MILASTIVDEVGTILNDMGDPMTGEFKHERWKIPELLNYLSEAIAAIAEAKPSVFITVERLALGPGPTQALPDQFNKIVNIHFNINPDGTKGSNVLPSAYPLQQAFQKPSCPPLGLIDSWALYPGSDHRYFVNPPVPSNLSYIPYVEAMVMWAPIAVTAYDQPIFMPGTAPQLFQGACVDWILYRVYGKDQESQTSMERSKIHFAAFGAYVGMSVQVGQRTTRTTPQRQQRQVATNE